MDGEQDMGIWNIWMRDEENTQKSKIENLQVCNLFLYFSMFCDVSAPFIIYGLWFVDLVIERFAFGIQARGKLPLNIIFIMIDGKSSTENVYLDLN